MVRDHFLPSVFRNNDIFVTFFFDEEKYTRMLGYFFFFFIFVGTLTIFFFLPHVLYIIGVTVMTNNFFLF